MTDTYKQLRLVSRPMGLPKPGDFEIVAEPAPTPADGEVLVETLYLSLDPAMRGWMNDTRSYVPPVKIGEVMRAFGVGRVVASKHAKFEVGRFVVGPLGIQEMACIQGAQLNTAEPSLAPLTAYLGVLGITGLTAYFGLLEVGEPEEGNTVLVSGAAGATGSVVGQIAKIQGCRVVGLAGSPEKCAYLTETLGFDAAVDYKGDDLEGALRDACSSGVDVYFDNVGGEILDLALARINRGARIVICGAISQYNTTEGIRGPSNYLALLVQRARMEGFIVLDYAPRFREAVIALAGWMAQGKLQYDETIVDGGVDAFHATLLRLFSGEKRGKLVLKVKDP